jgi:hypothetical protein
MSAMKKIFYYKFRTLNTQCMPDSTHLYQPVSLSPSAQAVPSSSSQTHNIPILLTAIPQHIIKATALDIQHFLKPLIVTCGEMCFHAVVIHID